MIAKFLRRLTGADQIPYLHEQIDLLREEVEGLRIALNRYRDDSIGTEWIPDNRMTPVCANKYTARVLAGADDSIGTEWASNYRPDDGAILAGKMQPDAIKAGKIEDTPENRVRFREKLKFWANVFGSNSASTPK